MHLRSVHRSAYYSTKPSSTLVRRDGSKSINDVLEGLGIFFIIFFALLGVAMAIRHFVRRVKEKKQKAQGQGMHLQSGSLRRNRQSEAARYEGPHQMNHSSPRSDWETVSSVTSPPSTHASSVAFSQSGHPSMPPYPAYSNDGFQPTPWASRPSSPFVVEDIPAARRHPQGNHWI